MATKKKTEITLNWHPNFRIASGLPDIKQVRTGFVVNFVAIFFALVALAWTLYTEVAIFNVNKDTARAQEQIDSNDKFNKTNVHLSTVFVANSKPLQFAAKFFAEKIPPLDLYSALIDARPDNIHFESVEITPYTFEQAKGKKVNTQRVVIAGTLIGDSDKLPVLEDFREKILAAPVLKTRVTDPANDCIIVPLRDAPGVYKFTVTIVLKPSA